MGRDALAGRHTLGHTSVLLFSTQALTQRAAKLKAQTEQLQNIDVDIMKVKSNLKRADLLLRAFMRRLGVGGGGWG